MIKFLADGLERCSLCLIPLEKGYEFIEKKHLICIWLMSQEYIILPDFMSEGLQLTPSDFIPINEVRENSRYRLKTIANAAYGRMAERPERTVTSQELAGMFVSQRRAQTQSIHFHELIRKWILEGKSAPTRKGFKWKFYKVKKSKKDPKMAKIFDKYSDTDTIFAKELKEEKSKMFDRDKPNPRSKKIKRANLYSKLLKIRPITDVNKELKTDKVLYRRK